MHSHVNVFAHSFCASAVVIVFSFLIPCTLLSWLAILLRFVYHFRSKLMTLKNVCKAPSWLKFTKFDIASHNLTATLARSIKYFCNNYIVAPSQTSQVLDPYSNSCNKAAAKIESFPEKVRSFIYAEVFFTVRCTTSSMSPL